MRISTRARYALRLMIDLADNQLPDAPIVLRDVARRQRISKRYLEQLATMLRTARLVKSVSGRGGGYALVRSADKISVAEIIDATLGPINVVQCVDCPELCPRSERCPSRDMWSEINARIHRVFEEITLADLREHGAEIPLCGQTPCTSASAENINTPSSPGVAGQEVQ